MLRAQSVAGPSAPVHRRPVLIPRQAYRNVQVAAAAAGTSVKVPWPIMWQVLEEKKLETIKAPEAVERAASGDWIIVDVRPSGDFEKSSAEGSVNVPLFQATDLGNMTPMGFLRATAFALNGVKPVEPNPNFSEELTKAAGGKKVILMCEAGGTMKPSANFMTGKASRSLKAAYLVIEDNLAPGAAHVDMGLYGWYLAKQPIRGDYDTSDVGRTPSAAAEPVIETPAEKKGWFK